MMTRRLVLLAPFAAVMAIFILLTLSHYPKAVTLSLIALVPVGIYVTVVQSRQA
jgi:hypothetical protein